VFIPFANPTNEWYPFGDSFLRFVHFQVIWKKKYKEGEGST
jgi:hypothetical protein